MKRLIYSLLSLAALFTVASCQPDKLIGGEKAVDDGTLVDATFAVNLGAQTKAFADGTTVDKLYAGIYEIGAADEYTWVADNADAPIAISGGAASVTFNGKISRGKSYKVVFWAQKEGAPYAINWAKNVTTGPAITATATGAANDETRDAFFGAYETGTVTGNIDLTGSPITLKRPFAQVNVLVPTAKFDDATAEVTSSMTVAQAPTVLNLATKATSDPADWTFSTAAISEAAFGTYASTHKYVAMNYVLVDQSAADPRYDVTFSVTSGSQVASDKQVKNAPLKVNGRTNIVGNIFAEDFDITVPIVIDPGTGTDQVVTTVTVAVGQTAAEAVELTYNPTDPAATSIEIAVSHPVEVEADKPQITVDPASVATAEWNLTTGKLDVTPLVANGNAVITLVFPAVTKTDYSAATVQVYVKVGNGNNATATTLSIDQDELTVKKGNTADFVVTASEGVGTLEIAPMENDYFKIVLKGQEGLNHTYTVTAKAVTTSAVTVTASGTASTEAYSAPEPATIQISVVDKEVVAQSVSFGDTKSKEVIIGASCDLGEYDGIPVPTATLAPNSALVYSLGNGTTENAFTLTEAGALTINARGKAEIVATAPQVETQDNVYPAASDTYTLTVKERLTNPSTQAAVSGNSINLTWTTDENADGYEIQYMRANDNFTAVQTVSIPVEKNGNYTWGPLVPDTYRFHVVAVAPENSFYANSSDVDLLERTISATFSVNQNTLNVEASVTSAQVTITSNQAWTVGNLTTGLEATPGLGSNDGTVTFTFPANESTTATPQYTATITPNTGDAVTITINQAAKVVEETIITDLSTVATLADNADIILQGTVAAITADANGGFVLTDGTTNIYVHKPATLPSMNQVVKVTGKKETSNSDKAANLQSVRVAAGATIETITATPVSLDATTDITSSIASYSSMTAKHITLSGEYSLSGNYRNLTVEGVTAVKGSISNPVSSLNLDSYSGKKIKVTGYVTGYSGDGKYIYIIVSAVEELPYLKVSPTTPTVNATVTSVEISIESNVAWSIDGDGVTASDASGSGDKTVTLSFAENETTDIKTLTATVSAAGCDDVTITITQNGTGTVSAPRYVKITSASELTNGNYLIVYETGNVAFNGGLSSLDVSSNTISVTISNGVIAQSAAVDAAVFTISAIEGGYKIKSASGFYIGRTAASNGISTSTTDAIINSISFESTGSATITSNGLNLRYNKTSGQTRFRYFTSAQEVIHLFKYVE